jgi:hypothetical protein
MICQLWITHGEMSSHAFIKTKFPKNSERCCQLSFSLSPLFGWGAK